MDEQSVAPSVGDVLTTDLGGGYFSLMVVVKAESYGVFGPRLMIGRGKLVNLDVDAAIWKENYGDYETSGKVKVEAEPKPEPQPEPEEPVSVSGTEGVEF